MLPDHQDRGGLPEAFAETHLADALAEGAPLANAADYVQRLNRLLVRLAAPPGAAS
ncbi:MAG TPA: hypothetical protein VF764_09550 [Steroidobacteraceae bacterium]